MDKSPASEHINLSLRSIDAETESKGKKTSNNGEKTNDTGNLEEGDKEQICKDEKKTTVQVLNQES